MNEFTLKDLVSLFEEANEILLIKDSTLFKLGVCERCICGSLMIRLHDLITTKSEFKGYYVDIEYNKQVTGDPKKVSESQSVIFTDIIIHSRGENSKCDNLIAIEMKKSKNSNNYRNDMDRSRLGCMTNENTIHQCVSNYMLGVFYEINMSSNKIIIEYYHKSKLMDRYQKNIRMLYWV